MATSSHPVQGADAGTGDHGSALPCHDLPGSASHAPGKVRRRRRHPEDVIRNLVFMAEAGTGYVGAMAVTGIGMERPRPGQLPGKPTARGVAHFRKYVEHHDPGHRLWAWLEANQAAADELGPPQTLIFEEAQER